MGDSKNLWGGRFTEAADETFSEFNRSFGFDKRLLAADVLASIAHCEGLHGAGIVDEKELRLICDGLNEIREKTQTLSGYLDSADSEDVHSFIESKLIESIGAAGGKLHTGRSRNDQVATALRIWLRDEVDGISNRIRALQTALLDLADENRDVVIPGYTHLQRAQPILLAHWCLAYFEMFARDLERLRDARRRINVMPLGSAAIAGTSVAIDRQAVARRLGFDDISRNSIDAVSDRDFCIETAGAASLVMVHLSRLAEDIIIYASAEFGFFELSDAVATGSSLMPQKKNPDSMELVRGKSGRVFGHLTGLLTTMKGLPLAYNKDMQEDKEAIFDTVDTVNASLSVTATVLKNVRVNEERTREAASTGYLNATELADCLVRKGVPFRRAHDIVGRIILLAIEKKVELNDLRLEELQSFSASIDKDVFDALSLERTLASKSQVGGTSPERVAEALAAARASLEGGSK